MSPLNNFFLALPPNTHSPHYSVGFSPWGDFHIQVHGWKKYKQYINKSTQPSKSLFRLNIILNGNTRWSFLIGLTFGLPLLWLYRQQQYLIIAVITNTHNTAAIQMVSSPEERHRKMLIKHGDIKYI